MWRIYYRRSSDWIDKWFYLDVETLRDLRAHCRELFNYHIEYYYRERVPLPY